MAEPEVYEHFVAGLSRDPGLSAFARPDAALLIWDAAGGRVLWASQGAQGLKGAFADKAGRIVRPFPDWPQVRALATGGAPESGFHLDRLRFDALSAAVTCVCRRAALPGGERILLTAIIGAPTRLAPADPPPEVAVETAPILPITPPEPSAPPAPARRERLRRDIRFTWQADAGGRFTQVSPALAEALGPQAGGLVGLTWAEMCRRAGVPEAAGLFKPGETWSGRVPAWRVDGSELRLTVDWGCMPVHGPAGALAGHRGYGIVRAPAAAEALPPASPHPIPPRRRRGDAERPVAGNHIPSTGLLSNPDAGLERLTPPGPANPAPALGSEPEARLSSSGEGDTPPSRLSAGERNAFREIARALRSRFEPIPLPPGLPAGLPLAPEAMPQPAAEPRPQPAPEARTLLDCLPAGALVYREERILHANPALLTSLGHDGLAALIAAGGLSRLFGGSPPLHGTEGVPMALAGRDGPVTALVDGAAIEWDGLPATLLLFGRAPAAVPDGRADALEARLAEAEARLREQAAALDLAADGVAILDASGRILSLSRAAEALLGAESEEAAGRPLTAYLAAESREALLADLARLGAPGLRGVAAGGREVLAQAGRGGAIPVFLTLGPLSDGPESRVCAVLRDLTAARRADEDLASARREAAEAGSRRSDLLARISHEIRTPLNAILGFAEVILEERFGPLGNERYKDYLQDVHESGARLAALVDSLLDLAEIEAGRRGLAFAGLRLNAVVSACIAEVQPEAARARIVLRTSFAPGLAPVIADERSLRQVALNILSNAVRFTRAGGQIIVSTAATDRGDVALRVRDTGIGMSEEEVAAALEPFRPRATLKRRAGSGLGLPLAKALVEAHGASLRIASAPQEGTLVEVLFPPSRVEAWPAA